MVAAMVLGGRNQDESSGYDEIVWIIGKSTIANAHLTGEVVDNHVFPNSPSFLIWRCLRTSSSQTVANSLFVYLFRELR